MATFGFWVHFQGILHHRISGINAFLKFAEVSMTPQLSHCGEGAFSFSFVHSSGDTEFETPNDTYPASLTLFSVLRSILGETFPRPTAIRWRRALHLHSVKLCGSFRDLATPRCQHPQMMEFAPGFSWQIAKHPS